MRARRILILTSSHLYRCPRAVKEAITLSDAGYEVTVLNVATQWRLEAMDRNLVQGLPLQHTTLDYTAATLAARTSNFMQRAATWAARQLCERFGLETAQALGPAAALLHRARSIPADLIIAHNEIPLWAAKHLIADGRRVAVDMEDWYSADLLPGERRSRPLGLLREAEAHALRHAAYVSAPSVCMAKELVKAFGGRPPLVLHNAFPLQAQPRTEPSSPPRLVWFSQTIGPGRGLESFLAAWARTTHPSKVSLIGDERAGFRTELLALLPPGRHGDVQFIPPMAPAQLPAKLAEFDIGLALELPEPPSRNLAITNKILQCMNAGLAIVATDTAGQAEVMGAAPDCGILVNALQTAAFAEKLDTLISDRDRLRAAQLASRRAAEREFCWEREAPRLLAAVEAALR